MPPSAPSPSSLPQPLVSTAWLAQALAAPDLRVVDATWLMPATGRNARQEFAAAHIPGAVFFDIDAIADRTTPKPHAVPSAEVFAAACGDLGLGTDCRIVVYDQNAGASAAARVWWLFRLFGHDRVAVLDGGLGAWRADGHPLTDKPQAPRPTSFVAHPRPHLLATADQVATASQSGTQVVDARSAGRWAATEPEPWPVPRVGRIPGSLNLPYPALLTGPRGEMAPADELAARFAEAGITPDRPMTVSCGSGVTACVLALAAAVQGRMDVAVYDGSWWAYSRTDHPVEP